MPTLRKTPYEHSPESIAEDYAAMMDSVNLINRGQPEYMSAEDWADTLSRNQGHLEIMLGKDFWTTEDMVPIEAAIAV